MPSVQGCPIYAPVTVTRHYKHVNRRVESELLYRLCTIVPWTMNYLNMDYTYYEDPIEPYEQGVRSYSFQGTQEGISSPFEDYEDDQGKYMRG